MPRLVTRAGFCGIAVLWCAGCASQETKLQQHAETLQSLRATVVAVGEAWLAGAASGTFAQTALEQTFTMTEQERTAMAPTPDDLDTPQVNALVRDGEQLSRSIAALTGDIRDGDGAGARRHVADLRPPAAERP